MRTPREQIIDAANKVRRTNTGGSLKPYTMRHLEQAVHVVRVNRAIDNKVLVAAGFNANRAVVR